MAKEIPEYAIVEDFGEIAQKLINLNEDRFGSIDHKILRMTIIVNKEPPERPPFYKIIRINNPVAMFCPFRYVIVSWKQLWEEWDEDRRALMVCSVLESLEPDEDEPKIKPPDLKEHSVMIRTFGPDYMDNPSIRGLLKKPIEWKDAPDFEYGSSKDSKDEGVTEDFGNEVDDDDED